MKLDSSSATLIVATNKLEKIGLKKGDIAYHSMQNDNYQCPDGKIISLNELISKSPDDWFEVQPTEVDKLIESLK